MKRRFYGARGKHRHSSSSRDDWRTPAVALERVRAVGPIALDPCAPTRAPRATGARTGWTKADNGLSRPWHGRRGLVFCNPPFGPPLATWAAKIARESKRAEIIALTPCRLDTRWSALLLEHCNLWACWRGRLRFELPGGRSADPAPFPVAFWYFGPRPERFELAFAPVAHVFASPRGIDFREVHSAAA